MTVRTVNLEYGMPPAEVAVRRMEVELSAARHTGQKLFKFVHGYGSTGKGGAIRRAARRRLVSLSGIDCVIPGEDFGPFSADARRAAEKWPALRSDSDWARSNDGITVVVMK